MIRGVALVWVAAAVALSGAATAAAPPGDGDRVRAPCRAWGPAERHRVDLRQVPLGAVTRLVSCATETNLALSPAHLAAKTVTVFAPRPVDRRALGALWRALLAEHDLVVERRGAYGIVRRADP